MDFELPNLLKVIGPAASIIFAAWIFMTFLQQRYDSAVERFKEEIEDLRSGNPSPDRRENIKQQVIIHKRRCDIMSRANLIGLFSAIFLIMTLISGEIDIVMPGIVVMKYISAGSALLGFGLVIVAAGFVIVEGFIARRQLDAELLDVSDLAHSIGHEAGKVSEL